MQTEKKVTFNNSLEIATDKKFSVVIDEEKDMVHFLGTLELDIVSLLLKEKLTYSQVFENISKEYEDCSKEELYKFLDELLEKDILVIVK